MSGRVPPGMLDRMTTPGRLEVTLDLEVPGDPIRGRISANGSPTRSFTGWLELTSRLVDLVNSCTGDGDRDPVR